jgi:hypothetical protein
LRTGAARCAAIVGVVVELAAPFAEVEVLRALTAGLRELASPVREAAIGTAAIGTAAIDAGVDAAPFLGRALARSATEGSGEEAENDEPRCQKSRGPPVHNQLAP